MQRNRAGWLGWLLFVFIIFGSQLVPPIARLLSQITGQPISTGMVFGGLIGLYVLITVAQSVIGGINRANRSSEVRLPSNTTVPSSPVKPPPARRAPTALPTPTTMDPLRNRTANRRPVDTPGAPLIRPTDSGMPPVGPPSFEPIIDRRVLAFGIAGVLVFGGFFLIVLFVSGVL